MPGANCLQRLSLSFLRTLFLLALFWGMIGSHSVLAEPGGKAPERVVSSQLADKIFKDDQLLICALRVKQKTLSEAITVYRYEKKSYLSFSEMMRALDFPITLDVDSRVAAGWFINELRKFELDYSKQFVKLNGKELALSEGSVFFFSMRFT